jgi:hypothetical protein
MCPYQLANTNHQHTQQTCTPARPVLQLKADQDTYKQNNHHTTKHHQPTHPPTTEARQRPRCSARVHYPIIKQPETHQPHPGTNPSRSLMPQTPNSAPRTPTDGHPHTGTAHTGEEDVIPLVNTPNRPGTNGPAHEVCSLERR